MGLFFGASVFTVIELIIYGSKISWIAISKKRRNYLATKKKKEHDREQRLRDAFENTVAVLFEKFL
jgi:hypothetical protein